MHREPVLSWGFIDWSCQVLLRIHVHSLRKHPTQCFGEKPWSKTHHDFVSPHCMPWIWSEGSLWVSWHPRVFFTTRWLSPHWATQNPGQPLPHLQGFLQPPFLDSLGFTSNQAHLLEKTAMTWTYPNKWVGLGWEASYFMAGQPTPPNVPPRNKAVIRAY